MILSEYEIATVTFCAEKVDNPVDGAYYFDHINIKSYVGYNGQWYQYEKFDQKEYFRLEAIKNLRNLREEKLNKIYEA